MALPAFDIATSLALSKMFGGTFGTQLGRLAPLINIEKEMARPLMIAITGAKSLESTITKDAGQPTDKGVKILVAQIKETLSYTNYDDQNEQAARENQSCRLCQQACGDCGPAKKLCQKLGPTDARPKNGPRLVLPQKLRRGLKVFRTNSVAIKHTSFGGKHHVTCNCFPLCITCRSLLAQKSFAATSDRRAAFGTLTTVQKICF